MVTNDLQILNQKSMKKLMKRSRKQSDVEPVTRKKKNLEYFALLPDDLLLEILQKLPSDILRYRTKFVCKKWFGLITDKILLDHASLLLEGSTGSNRIRLMDISEEKRGRFQLKEQYIDISYNGRIKCWCNEFLLVTDLEKEGSLYFFNLITEVGAFLPKCSTPCGGHYGCKCGVGLSYDKFKGVYKVVHVFWGKGLQIECELLIMKSNGISFDFSMWKKINGPYYTGQRNYYWDDPVSVQGRYLHWNVHCSKYLVSMDTVKERFRQTRLPASESFLRNELYFFVEVGVFLTILHKVSVDKFDMWMLKDYQKTNWEKLWSVSILNYVQSSCKLRNVFPFPLTCVKSKRYIIFRKPGPEGCLYAYDHKWKIMRRLEIDIDAGERCVVQTTSASF